MSSTENEIFREELKETSRLERGSSEESSESANGREPSEGSDEVAQTECLDSPKEDPPGDDHSRGAVEENPNYQMLEDITNTPTESLTNLTKLHSSGPTNLFKTPLF